MLSSKRREVDHLFARLGVASWSYGFSAAANAIPVYHGSDSRTEARQRDTDVVEVVFMLFPAHRRRLPLFSIPDLGTDPSLAPPAPLAPPAR